MADNRRLTALIDDWRKRAAPPPPEWVSTIPICCREEILGCADELAQELELAAAVARLPPQLQQSEHMEEAEMDDLRYLDVVQNPPVGGLFHWRDGFCFQRTKLGAVVMTLPDKSQKVIPPHEWASIVAYLSHAGETEETFRAALAFHGEPV